MRRIRCTLLYTSVSSILRQQEAECKASCTEWSYVNCFVGETLARRFEGAAIAGRLNKKRRGTRNPAGTRARLLQAAIELVAEKGEAALTIADAARRSRVARGTAYKHFRDRKQLLTDAKRRVAEGLREGLIGFDKTASLNDRTLYSSKLVLDNLEASKLMITGAMAGMKLGREDPLYEFLIGTLKEFALSGNARAGLDYEILAYIMIGSIASTVILGAQCGDEDVHGLAERFTKEWNAFLEDGIFARPAF